jgi:autotransporter-associated beta strand protein
VIHDDDYPVSSLSFDTTTSFTIGGWGTLTIATGSLTRSAASAGTQTITIPVALGANAVWNLAGSGQFIVSGAISGNYSLEKRGTGSLNLSGANTYTGLTRVQNGTLNVSGGSTTSTAFDILSGATLSFTGNGLHFTTTASFSNSGTLSVGKGSNLTITGNLTGTGNTVVNGLMTADSIVQNTLTIGNGATLRINAIAGGPLSDGTTLAVPEPGILIMLLIAAAAAGWMRKSVRRIGR